MSGNNVDAQWPPRSPHEVLLSTPGGRERLRRLAERASPSPSPLKRSASKPLLRNKSQDLPKVDMEDDMEDDEDEETLQLQLQEIQARLKLKRLQKKAKQSSDTENEQDRAGSAQTSRPDSIAANRAQSRLAGLRQERLERSKSQASAHVQVHVPVSPVRKIKPVEPQRSPGRVLLGIDKGLKGSDISLKRAPSLRRRDEASSQDRLAGPFLQRAPSQAGNRARTPGLSSQGPEIETRPKSFSERMATIRAQEADREERELRIKKNRSMTFDIDQNQMQRLKEAAVEFPEGPRETTTFSREEVLNSFNQPSKNLPRSKTTPNLRSAMRNASDCSATNPATSERSDSRASPDILPKRASTKSKSQPSEVTESEASQFEPYSLTHLSRRIIPHQALTRTLQGKKNFLIPDLLRTVKALEFLGPDIEEDIVVFGIIAKKSEPLVHQNNVRNKDRGKYMILSLTDLKWELDLFLFDSGFDKFWKLVPGTIIAILNPTFLAPRKDKVDTGKWSLALNSDDDTILEIGTARDFGYCKSIKKDGKTCDSWVNKRHTEFCEYHINLQLTKTHNSRMEINTMNFGKGGYGNRKFNSKDMTNHFERERERKMGQKTRYDRESSSQIYIGKKSTVSLLDDVDFDPDAFHRGFTKEERMMRRILSQEKEQELQKKLANMGGGLGADYMRKQTSSDLDPDPGSSMSTLTEVPPDAASLGLLGGKAKDVALSPVKRKRADTASSSAAVGWGSNLSKELGKMKNGENLLPQQPVKKKTRFVTEKGIREAGRESFGGTVAAGGNDIDDDDDDDLDIVKE